MYDLKLCPFCGKEVRLMYCEEDGTTSCVDGDEEEMESQTPAFIHCYGCDMDYFPADDNPVKVMELWNERTVGGI